MKLNFLFPPSNNLAEVPFSHHRIALISTCSCSGCRFTFYNPCTNSTIRQSPINQVLFVLLNSLCAAQHTRLKHLCCSGQRSSHWSYSTQPNYFWNLSFHISYWFQQRPWTHHLDTLLTISFCPPPSISQNLPFLLHRIRILSEFPAARVGKHLP